MCSCPANLNIGTDGATCECPEGMVPGVGPDTCKQAPSKSNLVICFISSSRCLSEFTVHVRLLIDRGKFFPMMQHE